MTVIYYLQHTIRRKEGEDQKGIGTFSAYAKAHEAVKMLRDKPGFRLPNGNFSIFKVELNKIYRSSGLDTLNNIATEGVPGTQQANPGQLVHFAYWDDPERDNDSILIGYFSTRELAEAALDDAKTWLPDATRGELDVSISVVDRVNWLEGFGPAD